ncbi:ABC transporter substrate-binding protein [Bauldia sp.]|uniref:ABC transporter substrate-binding protein n=1 Tax=Bauldia sp. TaxID=2575872 RepID=UPI003BA88E25
MKSLVRSLMMGAALTVTGPAFAEELNVAANYFSTIPNGDMAALDPARRGTWSFHSLLWAPLVAGDTAGNPIPEKSLAESWEMSEDGKSWTFNLRPDAKFSDGTPIDAEDVALSWGYLAMMTNPESFGFRDNFGSARRMFGDIEGLKAFTENVAFNPFGTGEVGDFAGIEVVDDHTVRINFTRPAENFLSRLTAAFAVFKPEDLYAGADANYDISDFWTSSAAASGPYMIEEAVPGERYTMVPNPNYFGPAHQIDRINVLAVSEDPNTALTAFANGELDIVAFPLVGDLARQAYGDPAIRDKMMEVPMWQVQQYWITPNPPMDDVNVRRAFSMALNREALVSVLNGGSELRLVDEVNMHRNPNVPHCEAETAAVTAMPFDPEAAKAELAKSAYADDILDMEINISVRSPDELPAIEVYGAMLEQALGLTNINIRTEQVEDRNNPPFPVHLHLNTQQPWYADLTDTLQNMIFIIPDEPYPEGLNHSFFNVPYIPELVPMVQEAMATTDPDQRCALVAEIGQIWNDKVFSIDYAVPKAFYLVQPWVEGDLDFYRNAGQSKPLNLETWSVGEKG